jgi:hypothetical protein
MNGSMYYISLAAIAIIAIHFFRRGHFMLSLAALAVGAWTIYSHEEQITYDSIKHDVYTTIDDAAKSEYDTKVKTEIYDYNKSKVGSGTSKVKAD